MGSQTYMKISSARNGKLDELVAEASRVLAVELRVERVSGAED